MPHFDADGNDTFICQFCLTVKSSPEYGEYIVRTDGSSSCGACCKSCMNKPKVRAAKLAADAAKETTCPRTEAELLDPALFQRTLDRIATTIFDQLGITIDWHQHPVTDIDDLLGKFVNFGVHHINPKMTGPMAPMFTEIKIRIHAGLNGLGTRLYFRFEYKYEHPQGSNGYDHRFDIAI